MRSRTLRPSQNFRSGRIARDGPLGSLSQLIVDSHTGGHGGGRDVVQLLGHGGFRGALRFDGDCFQPATPIRCGRYPGSGCLDHGEWLGRLLAWWVHFHDKLCTELPGSGELKCWDASSQKIPDAARPPDPPGFVEVIMPWWGEKTIWEWLLTGVTVDLAAGGVAAGLVWLAFRPFGQHANVDINPFD